MLIRIMIFVLLIVSVSTAQQFKKPTSVAVSNVTFLDMRALDVFKRIAERYKVVIGVSGILVGPDNHRINFSLEKGTVADLLNSAVHEDTRFEWSEGSDGGVKVSVKNSPLSLMNVVVKDFRINNPPRYRMTEILAETPEIHDWLHNHSCEVMQMISGRPPADTWMFTLKITNESLQSTLNRIAQITKTYFWSAIQFHTDPCAINLVP